MISGVLLDLGGVLHVGSTPLSGAQESVARLRAHGVALRFITNTTRSTRAMVVAKLRAMGFAVEEHELFTAPLAARDHLLQHGLRPYLVVHPAVLPEFADVATVAPNAVLLGDAGSAINYAALNQAFRLLMAGAPLLAMGRNRYFLDDEGLNLDAGPFVAALEYAAGVEAQILGKPAAAFYHAAVAALGCPPEQVVMVGDDVEADVVGAATAGLQAVLVQTGKFRAGDEAQVGGPQMRTLPDLTAVVDWILENR